MAPVGNVLDTCAQRVGHFSGQGGIAKGIVFGNQDGARGWAVSQGTAPIGVGVWRGRAIQTQNALGHLCIGHLGQLQGTGFGDAKELKHSGAFSQRRGELIRPELLPRFGSLPNTGQSVPDVVRVECVREIDGPRSKEITTSARYFQGQDGAPVVADQVHWFTQCFQFPNEPREVGVLGRSETGGTWRAKTWE